MLAGVATAWNRFAVLSTSVAVSVPLTSVIVASSAIVPTVVPPITAASFAPLIVTVTSFVVPSIERTVKLSVSGVLLVLRALTVGFALFSVYVHTPADVIVNVP